MEPVMTPIAKWDTIISWDSINGRLQAMVDKLNAAKKKTPPVIQRKNGKIYAITYSDDIQHKIDELNNYCDAYSKLGIKDENGKTVMKFILMINLQNITHHVIAKYRDGTTTEWR